MGWVIFREKFREKNAPAVVNHAKELESFGYILSQILYGSSFRSFNV